MAISDKPRSLLARMTKRLVSLALLFIGAALVAWFASRPVTPDAFYRHPLPADAAPGSLVKSERYTAPGPVGAQIWRMLYVTSRGGNRTLASAIVVLPTLAGGKRPVVAWAHGTTGIVEGCAPSALGRPFDHVPSIDEVVRQGWAYVGTDYAGLGTAGGHAYLVGEDAARAVLDAVRAARQMKDANLSDRTVVWGHSQGGNTALWTGIRAAALAPELNIVGIAALAPASDLKGLVQASKSSAFGKIVSSYVLVSYARVYPDVRLEDYVGPASRLVARDIASRCVVGYQALFSVLSSNLLPADGLFVKDPTSGALGARLGENTPSADIPMPTLIAQGEADDLVRADVQRRYVQARCSTGQPLDYRTYPGRDHLSVVSPDSPLVPELLAWTRDRLDGKPAANTCP